MGDIGPTQQHYEVLPLSELGEAVDPSLDRAIDPPLAPVRADAPEQAPRRADRVSR